MILQAIIWLQILKVTKCIQVVFLLVSLSLAYYLLTYLVYCLCLLLFTDEQSCETDCMMDETSSNSIHIEYQIFFLVILSFDSYNLEDAELG